MRRLLPLFLIPVVLISTAPSQEPAPNEKAERYLRALEKRPSSEILFDRFFDAWLETRSMEELEAFLTGRLSRPGDKFLLAQFFIRLGKEETAERWLAETAEDESAAIPLRAGAWKRLAEFAERSFRFEEALVHTDRALALIDGGERPGPAAAKQGTDLLKRKGRLLIRSGRIDRGLAEWRRVLDSSPEDATLREDIIQLLCDEGLFDQAVEEQNRVIALAEDPYEKVSARMALGQIFRRADRRDEAIATWRTVLPETGHGTWFERELLALMQHSYDRKDDLRGWRATLEELIADEPGRLALQIAHADLLTRLREDRKALETWERILKLTPGDKPLRLRFVRTLAQLDRPGEAAERMRQLVELAPEDAELEFELADLFARSNRLEPAGDHLEAFLAKSDGSEYAHLRTARQLHRIGLETRADAVYRKLVEAFPESPDALEAQALFLYETNRKDRALGIWESLAREGSLRQLLRVSRQLVGHRETGTAYRLLENRSVEGERDKGFLAEIANVALMVNRADDAFRFARKRVDLAATTRELDESLTLAVKAAARGDDPGRWIRLIKGETSPSLASRCLAGLLLNQVEGAEAAISELRRLADSSPAADAVFPLFTMARIQRQEQCWHEASKTMERVVLSPGGRKTSNISELVNLFGRAMDSRSALKWTREWKKIAPGNPLPWLHEADTLQSEGRIRESLEVLRDAVRRFDHSTEARLRLARTYSDSGYPAEAERTLWKLYEEAKDEWARHGWIDELVLMARQHGRLDQLIATFEERQRNNSESVPPLLALAEVYRLADRNDDYREALLSAGRIEPGNILLIHRIASLEESEGRFDSAIRLLEQMLPGDGSPRTVEKLARLHLNLGNVAEALSLMEEMPSGKKASADQLVAMAQTIATIGEWETLAVFLERKLTDHPDHPGLHYVRALALLQAGRGDEARDAFLDLLTFEAPPLPASNGNAASPRAPSLFTGYPSASNWKLPPEVEELHSWTSMIGYPKRIHEQWGEPGTVYSLAGFSHQGPLQLPATTEQIRAYAAGFLLGFPPAPALDREMTAAGLPRHQLDLGRVFLELSDSYSRIAVPTAGAEAVLEKRRQTVRELLDRHPGNAALHFFWAQHSLLPPDLSDRAVSLVEQSFGPEHAAVLAFQIGNPVAPAATADHDQPLSGEVIGRGIELISSLDEVPDYLVRQLAGFALAILENPGLRDDPPLPPESWNRLQGLIRGWELRSTEPKEPWGDIATFQQVMRYLANTGATGEWIRRLNAEVDRFDAIRSNGPVPVPPPVNYQRQMQRIFQSGWVNYSRLPSIPPLPDRLPGISPAALSLLQAPNGPGIRFTAPHQSPGGTALGIFPPDLRERLGEFSGRPLIGALLSYACGDHEFFDRMVGVLREKSESDPDSLSPAEELFLAHRDHAGDDHQLAADRFARVRRSPLDAEIARTIDLALVALARGAPESSDLRTTGLDAAIRLRSSKNLTEASWRPVAETLREWGKGNLAALPAHAHRLISFNNPVSRPGAAFRLSDVNTLQRRIAPLLENGNTGAAVRLSARLLPLLSGKLFGFNGEQRKQEFTNLVSDLSSHEGVIDGIIETLRPAPGGDVRRLDKARFAAVCEILGRDGLALNAYNDLLSENDRDATARLRRLQLLVTLDPEKAIFELGDLLKKESSSALGVRALESLTRSRLPIDAQLDFTAELLGLLDEDASLLERGQWLSPLASRLDDSLNDPFLSGNSDPPFRLPGLFDTSLLEKRYRPEFPGELREQYDGLIRRRLELYIRLCRRGVGIPTHGSRFFSDLVRLGQIEQVLTSAESAAALLPPGDPLSDDSLLELCRKALTVHPPNASGAFGQVRSPEIEFTGESPGWKYPDNPAPPWTASGPVPWIVEHAFRRNGPEIIAETTASLREKRGSGSDPMIRTIEGLSRLYFCPPEEFLEAVTAFQSLTPALPGHSSYSWRFVHRALALRPQLNDHFTPDTLLLEQIARFPSDDLVSMAGLRTRQLALSGGEKSALAFLDRFTRSLIGEQTRREDFIRTYLPGVNQGYVTGTEAHRMSLLLRHVSRMASFPETVFPAARFCRESGLSQKHRMDWSLFRGSSRIADADMLLVLIRNSPLQSELENYEFFPAEDYHGFSNQGHDLLVGSLLDEIREDFRSSSRKDQRERLLKTLEGDTFGTRLLHAVISDSDEAILDVFDGHVVAIQDLPGDRRKKFGLLAARLIQPKNLPRKLDPDQIATMRWIGEESGEGEAAKMDRLIRAKTIADTGASESRFFYEMRDRISLAIRFDWEKAFDAFVNVSRIGETALQRRAIRPPRSSRPDFTGPLLEGILRHADFVSGFAFTNRALHAPELRPISIAEIRFTDPIHRQLSSAASHEERISILSGVAMEIDANLDADSALVIPIFFQLLNQQSSGLLPKVREWAGGRNGKALIPEVARDIDIAAAIAMGDAKALQNRQGPVYLRLREVLSEKRFPPGVRLAVSKILCDAHPGPDDEFIRLSAGNLAESWAGDVPVNVYTAREILEPLEQKYRILGPDQWIEGNWAPLDEMLGEAFHRRYVSGQEKCSYENLLRSVMSLQLRRGAPALANLLHRKYEPEIRRSSTFFVELVRFGEFESANRMLRSQTAKVIESAPSWQFFDPSLATNLSPFLKTLQDASPWLRWTAEMFLCSASDPGSEYPAAKGWPDRNGRLLECAKKFDPTLVPDEEILELILDRMLGDHEIETALEPAIRRLSDGATLEKLYDPKFRIRRRARLKIFNAGLSLDISRGNPENVLRVIREIDEHFGSPSRKNDRNEALGVLGGFAETATNRYGKNPEAAEALLPVWTAIASRKDFRRNSYRSYVELGYLMSCFVRCDREAELNGLFASLPEKTRQTFTHLLKERRSQVLQYYRYTFSGLSRPEERAYTARFESLDLPALDHRSIVRERVATFLGASTAGETGISPGTFENEVSKMMVAAGSMTERRAIYRQAIELVRAEQGSPDGWGQSYWNGWSYSSEQLREYCEESPPGSWDGLVTIADVLWYDTPRDFSYTWSNTYHLGPVYRVIWENARSGHSPAEALPIVLDRLREKLPPREKWGSPLLFFPQFFEFCGAIRIPEEIVAAILSARELAEDKDDPLAREFAAAGSFWLHTRDPRPAAAGKLAGLDSWEKHIRDGLASPSTSPEIKMALARHVLMRASREKCPDGLRRKLTRLSAELLLEEVPVNGWALMLLIKEFNRLPVDPDWEETARLFLEGWNRKCRHDDLPRNRGIGFHPVTDARLAMLQLLLRLDDGDALNGFLEKNEPKIEKSSRALLLLAGHGRGSLAREWIGRNGAASYSPSEFTVSHGSFDLRFLPAYHETLAPFIAPIPSAGERFLIHYILASAPDPPAREQIHLKNRPPGMMARLGKLASTFDEVDFENGKNRNEAILLIGSRWQTASKILPQLEETFRSAAIEDIPRKRSTVTVENNVRPLAAYAVAKVGAGNAGPFRELVTRLADAPVSRSSAYRQRAFERSGEELGNLIQVGITTMNPGQLAAASEAANILLETIDEPSSSRIWADLMTWQIAFAAIDPGGDGSAALSDWREHLPPQERASLQKVWKTNRDRIIDRLPNVMKLPTRVPFPEDQRRRIIGTLLSDPWFQDCWEESDQPVVGRLLTRGLLPRALVEESRESWIECWPRVGRTRAEIEAWLEE